MKRSIAGLVLVVLLAAVASATALAQRFGGFQGGDNRVLTPTTNIRYDGKFTFVRMRYPWNSMRNPPWSHDYPVGEAHFMNILTFVSNVDGHVEESNILDFGDPEMFKYPVIYLVEPGFWSMTDTQATALHDYLVKGGFMIVDDFPAEAWANFDLQMSRVFPQGRWHDLDETHATFHSFFETSPATTPPSYRGTPAYRGLFEDNDVAKRLYVIANYRNDLSEYWESSEKGTSVVSDDSNEAYKIGVNQFIYGITH